MLGSERKNYSNEHLEFRTLKAGGQCLSRPENLKYKRSQRGKHAYTILKSFLPLLISHETANDTGLCFRIMWLRDRRWFLTMYLATSIVLAHV